MEVKTCVYCEEEKPVLPNVYNEPVCRDCAHDLIDQRFDEALKEKTHINGELL